MTVRTIIRLPAIGSNGKVDTRGLDDFSRDLSKAAKDIQKEVKSLGRSLMKPAVDEAKAKAARGERQQRAMAKGSIIRTEFYRGAPAIKAGGSQKVAMSFPTRANARGKHMVPAGAVFIGAEFGAIYLPQFPKRTAKLGRGNAGSFLWPAIRENVNTDALLKEFFARTANILQRRNI